MFRVIKPSPAWLCLFTWPSAAAIQLELNLEPADHVISLGHDCCYQYLTARNSGLDGVRRVEQQKFLLELWLPTSSLNSYHCMSTFSHSCYVTFFLWQATFAIWKSNSLRPSLVGILFLWLPIAFTTPTSTANYDYYYYYYYRSYSWCWSGFDLL